jgi:DNA adenine methylase
VRAATLQLAKSPNHQLRPLLKWAGGKRQLLPQLRPFYPATFSRYIEPFFGSGAVFFDLKASGRLDGHDVLLVDSNADLIGCYETVRAQPEAVADELDRLAAAHARGGEAQYYAVRDGEFNPARDRLRDGSGRIAYTPALAAMLIYLNRTGFNGLFRLNSRGDFNVPVGRYTNPRICDAGLLRRVARAFRSRSVTLERASFEVPLANAGVGDFVYCDPPYAPLSETARFANYTAGGFSPADQIRLQQAVVSAARRGATVLVSNSSAPLIETLYSGRDSRSAGLEMLRVPARRAINSKAASRGPVDELLITNSAAASRLDRLAAVKPKMARAGTARTARRSA